MKRRNETLDAALLKEYNNNNKTLYKRHQLDLILSFSSLLKGKGCLTTKKKRVKENRESKKNKKKGFIYKIKHAEKK
jgi:hypothetical protein